MSDTPSNRTNLPRDSDDRSEPDFPLLGAIPKIERQRTHYEFLWAVRPPAAVTDLEMARRMAAHDETADSFFPPETDVILTTTINDTNLSGYTFTDEYRVIRAFEPDYVLPFDFPVYGQMRSDLRQRYAKQVAAGTLDMDYALGDLSDIARDQFAERKDGLTAAELAGEPDTTVLPLVKGTTPSERALCERVVIDSRPPLQAKYAAQYFTTGGGFSGLRDDLEAIYDETNGYPTLVVGHLSPSGQKSLQQLPENVVAATGLSQWLSRVDPRDASSQQMRERFAELSEDVARALDVPDRYDRDHAAATGDDPPEAFLRTPSKTAVITDGGVDLRASGAATRSEYRDGDEARKTDPAAPAATQALATGAQPEDVREQTEELVETSIPSRKSD